MLNLSQISLWGPIIPVTCILPSVRDQIYTRGARAMRAQTAGSEGGWRSSRVWRRRADSWAPCSGARCGSRALPPSCRGCQGEPLREAAFLQALPKTIENTSKHLEEEQSENLLPLNKIISSSVYAFLWDCRSSAEPSAKRTVEYPLVHSELTRWKARWKC